ncbi:lachesin-like [Acyrthosiphon pisum]|uniref:Ig-like domain-containing protein n=1 Tax=Acyrthosiphon pisum TaxID=7029 RepID=A0A8R2NLN9_ACYPI|nr:lachesin-like [Acyrthosiphon pisum]
MTPIITHISQNQIKDVGDKAEMECTVSNPLDYYVLWTKFDLEKSNDSILFSFGSTLNIKDSRLSITKDSKMDLIRYTLQINDIQQVDSGFYHCQIIIGLHHIISAKVELKVRGPPMIHDNSTSSMVVMEGQQVTLECYASGNPSTRIFWKRENNGILSVNRSIYK